MKYRVYWTTKDRGFQKRSLSVAYTVAKNSNAVIRPLGFKALILLSTTRVIWDKVFKFSMP